MFETAYKLIAQQQLQFNIWGNNAIEIGNFNTDEVWNKLKLEFSEKTSKGLIWNCAKPIKSSFFISMSASFADACKRLVIQPIAALSSAMQSITCSSWNFSTAYSSFDTLKKSLRIPQRVKTKFDQNFSKTNLDMLYMVRRALSNDIHYLRNGVDRHTQKTQPKYMHFSMYSD